MSCLLILLKSFSSVKCGYVTILIVLTEAFVFWKIDIKCSYDDSLLNLLRSGEISFVLRRVKKMRE